ncbi:MAG: DMT family transporter [Alphaproteobacteria bacterium]|nr:DMT family transporter [Alphaproteobacteria bacterium]
MPPNHPPSPDKPLSMSPLDWLLLVTLSVLWAGSFLFAKIALADLPPLTLGLGRVAIAAAIIAILIKPLGGTVPRDFETWRRFTILATVNNAIPFTLILLGQIHITIGLASILNATSPLFTALIAHWMTQDDKLNRGRILGVAVGFAGVVILLGPDLLSELGTQVWAQLALLGAALSYSFGALYARRMRGLPPVTIAGGQLAMATVVLLPFALAIDGPWAFARASAGSLAAMTALAAFSTAIAYLMYFRLIARAGATNAILVTFLIPVSAILLGIALLNEAVEPRQILGMLTIFAGLAAIDGRLVRAIGRSFHRTKP